MVAQRGNQTAAEHDSKQLKEAEDDAGSADCAGIAAEVVVQFCPATLIMNERQILLDTRECVFDAIFVGHVLAARWRNVKRTRHIGCHSPIHTTPVRVVVNATALDLLLHVIPVVDNRTVLRRVGNRMPLLSVLLNRVVEAVDDYVAELAAERVRRNANGELEDEDDADECGERQQEASVLRDSSVTAEERDERDEDADDDREHWHAAELGLRGHGALVGQLVGLGNDSYDEQSNAHAK